MPIKDPTNNEHNFEKARKSVKKHEPDWQPQEPKYVTGGPVEAGKEIPKAGKSRPQFGEKVRVVDD